jgi:hypothetical protein
MMIHEGSDHCKAVMGGGQTFVLRIYQAGVLLDRNESAHSLREIKRKRATRAEWQTKVVFPLA